jgi:transposase
MISVIWNGMGVPLIWTLLPSAGNSNTKARTDLLDRLQGTFSDLKIASLMGDREFIGDAWMAYLSARKIPFILRLRENQHVVREGYDTWTIADIARRLDKGQKMIIKSWCRLGQDAGKCSPFIRLVVMRLPTGEFLAIACSSKPHRALASYRQRWTIETLFANLKTKGFNLEDTHITDPDKLSTLLAVLALTVTLCIKTGLAAARLRPIPIKKHGRRAWSLFALGVGVLRKITVSAKPAQIIAFLQQLLSSKLPVNELKSIGV